MGTKNEERLSEELVALGEGEYDGWKSRSGSGFNRSSHSEWHRAPKNMKKFVSPFFPVKLHLFVQIANKEINQNFADSYNYKKYRNYSADLSALIPSI